MVFDTETMDEDDLALARVAGKWGHPEGMCPRDIPEEDPHTYRVDILVFRDDDPEPRARVSKSVEAASFAEASTAAGEALNTNWQRLLEMGSMVDDD